MNGGGCDCVEVEPWGVVVSSSNLVAGGTKELVQPVSRTKLSSSSPGYKEENRLECWMLVGRGGEYGVKNTVGLRQGLEEKLLVLEDKGWLGKFLLVCSFDDFF